MNRARKTSSCGCFRSAFCLLKPSTSSSSGEHGDSDKKLLSAQMSATRDDDDQANSHPSRPIKVPPLDLNGVEKRISRQEEFDGELQKVVEEDSILLKSFVSFIVITSGVPSAHFARGRLKWKTCLNCLVKQPLVLVLVLVPEALSPKSFHPQHVLN